MRQIKISGKVLVNMDNYSINCPVKSWAEDYLECRSTCAWFSTKELSSDYEKQYYDCKYDYIAYCKDHPIGGGFHDDKREQENEK